MHPIFELVSDGLQLPVYEDARGIESKDKRAVPVCAEAHADVQKRFVFGRLWDSSVWNRWRGRRLPALDGGYGNARQAAGMKFKAETPHLEDTSYETDSQGR